jgi:hypothetical protein
MSGPGPGAGIGGVGRSELARVLGGGNRRLSTLCRCGMWPDPGPLVAS